MSTEPVIHRSKQRRVVIVANQQPQAAPAPAIGEATADRPVFKLKARSSTPAAVPAQAGKVATVAAASAGPVKSA
jgi:hypothetical protein